MGSIPVKVLAVLTPAAICYKPLCICLHNPRRGVNYNAENNQKLEYEFLQDSPLMPGFSPKNKKYVIEPISIIYEPYFASAPEVSSRSPRSLIPIPSGPDVDFREIIKIPSVHKTLAQVEDRAIRHVPVVEKVTRNVVECRTRHVPVIRHRLRTVEEKYTEHVPVVQTITRPVVDTIVKQVPVIEAKKRGHQRMKTIPTEQRVVNELFKLKQNPLYMQRAFGFPCLCPQICSQACLPCKNVNHPRWNLTT